MTATWAVRLNREDIAPLGRLVQTSSLDVCTQNESIWLRAKRVDDSLETRLRNLPGPAFQVLADQQLRPADHLVPCGVLPQGPWVPLSEWLRIELPRPAFAGQVTAGVSIQLTRQIEGRRPCPASILITDRQGWFDYAIVAPQLRLNLWSFASSDQHVLIRGMHLPALVGERFVETDGIAAPLGWTWTPNLSASVIRQAFGLAAGDVALLRLDGWWDHIGADKFVQASRASVRASHDGGGKS